jgi:hypothetical protein
LELLAEPEGDVRPGLDGSDGRGGDGKNNNRRVSLTLRFELGVVAPLLALTAPPSPFASFTVICLRIAARVCGRGRDGVAIACSGGKKKRNRSQTYMDDT